MNSIRPGVYTSYSLIPTKSAMSRAVIGVAAAGSEVPGVQKVTSFLQAKAMFGTTQTALLAFLKAIFAHAEVSVYAVSVLNNQYHTAFEALLQQPISLLCTDCADTPSLTKLALTLQQAAASGHAVVGIAGSTQATPAKALAATLNCERLCLTVPALVDDADTNVAPAVLAGMIADADDQTNNLNGAITAVSYHAATAFPDTTLRELMDSGLCVFQQSGSFTELLRGMTTKTKDENGNPDKRFQNLSVILIADQVVTDVRNILTEKLLGSGNGRVTLDSVLALIICTLEEHVVDGALTAYDTPILELDEQDRSICHVSLSFLVRQGIYQVYLHAVVSI